MNENQDTPNEAFVSRLQAEISFPKTKESITIDGIHVEWNDGFALVWPSNTTPVVVLRLEGDSLEALERIKSCFGVVLKKVDSL